MSVRKGDYFRRKGDGFLFVAQSTTRRDGGGAFLQCTEATAICGWYWTSALKMNFDRLTPSEYRNEKGKRSAGDAWDRCDWCKRLDVLHRVCEKYLCGDCRTQIAMDRGKVFD